MRALILVVFFMSQINTSFASEVEAEYFPINFKALKSLINKKVFDLQKIRYKNYHQEKFRKQRIRFLKNQTALFGKIPRRFIPCNKKLSENNDRNEYSKCASNVLDRFGLDIPKEYEQSGIAKALDLVDEAMKEASKLSNIDLSIPSYNRSRAFGKAIERGHRNATAETRETTER